MLHQFYTRELHLLHSAAGLVEEVLGFFRVAQCLTKLGDGPLGPVSLALERRFGRVSW
ncbi:hypothetical protein OV208_40060 [Corallococcus sp. bb12-1]|uniref:hypothetical protein n=1 Tax=Corallococcus sp. bb12-1 TaxID=2996784 RepID=UPI00226D9E3B|nr:hypothetical protein [Corallococcus sp. bb12-1]MCY1047563.1 hypothetical protein [Corallococcus sp. bb12-1]